MSAEDSDLLELDPQTAIEVVRDEQLYCARLRAGKVAVGGASEEDPEPLVTHIHDCPWGVRHAPVPGLSPYDPDIATRI